MQIDTLQRKIDETQAVCRSLKQRSSSYAMQRGILILIALFALFRGYYYEQLFYVLCVLSLGLFLYVAAKHRALKQKIEDHAVMLEVLQDVLRRKNNGWKAFQDTGAEFLYEENTQAYDLDRVWGREPVSVSLCGKNRIRKRTTGRASQCTAAVPQSDAKPQCCRTGMRPKDDIHLYPDTAFKAV